MGEATIGTPARKRQTRVHRGEQSWREIVDRQRCGGLGVSASARVKVVVA